MFCEQCEQTASGQGCHQWGACGKGPDVNAVQDLLIYCLRGIAPVALKAKELGIDTHAVDVFCCESMFATMTNVNFNRKRFYSYIREAIAQREKLKTEIQQMSDRPISWSVAATYQPDWTDSLVAQGEEVSRNFIADSSQDIDIFSLKLTVLYGLKGLASYSFHAQELGQEDDRIYSFCHQALAALEEPSLGLEDWVNLAMKVGEMNLLAMELLDAGHTNHYGHPIPTVVPLNAKAGKAILVSGHDIKQLEAILQQTANTGINVYTHGELLPAHGYPVLKQKYPHLYGHYGTAWQNQTKDFAKFPGAIVITTNCLMPPHEHYEDKLFTLGPVGYPDINYLEDRANLTPDFSPAIHKALALAGFAEDEPPRQVKTGFARNAVLNVSDQVIEAVKQGKIRHFFLVGGCDGAKPDRNYYTEFVDQVPSDCVVLTLACGKFRFFDKEMGEIGNIPRLMDVGQCNDAYSAIQIALGLAQAFDIGVNELPLSMILSWYEQKAVAVLLTLLYLGIKDIRLGPTLPAFISPNVFAILSAKYNLQAITTPEADLAACLN
ncbi:hydroxylamine reductase [Arthrospira platensis]|jgi:hydroxylamine reductase|uniref:Hydroxylamine reductase n=1 Tax=Limnospira platensis NIES-46 TaxID=1236695 RepID=A0A5M3T7Y2_LIMPL|nr:hydroxylamine reductase [Arthrospira platensis]AMW30007.1 hydroxylamine reductase [Arthrospira platensis YZ]MBD2670875.1 hydroxylamine reductase [Arthrospira platensis FACHB-439]MBD2712991.1 hydroxylamine reductase [Arthrospira platensis FACHB-835]MDF2211935.1 hydroxylamine reductase [Arthrospira platensis NCB002]MDT9296366.1 hydroxylamine reductase [Arthrospira platensis PCC 7345]QQW27964.1 hydroxylamine reductase [Arthrospira sp. PCC 9108]BAI92562.1 hydroxylamine reductase [Arthrospira 